MRFCKIVLQILQHIKKQTTLESRLSCWNWRELLDMNQWLRTSRWWLTSKKQPRDLWQIRLASLNKRFINQVLMKSRQASRSMRGSWKVTDLSLLKVSTHRLTNGSIKWLSKRKNKKEQNRSKMKKKRVLMIRNQISNLHHRWESSSSKVQNKFL